MTHPPAEFEQPSSENAETKVISSNNMKGSQPAEQQQQQPVPVGKSSVEQRQPAASTTEAAAVRSQANGTSSGVSAKVMEQPTAEESIAPASDPEPLPRATDASTTPVASRKASGSGGTLAGSQKVAPASASAQKAAAPAAAPHAAQKVPVSAGTPVHVQKIPVQTETTQAALQKPPIHPPAAGHKEASPKLVKIDVKQVPVAKTVGRFKVLATPANTPAPTGETISVISAPGTPAATTSSATAAQATLTRAATVPIVSTSNGPGESVPPAPPVGELPAAKLPTSVIAAQSPGSSGGSTAQTPNTSPAAPSSGVQKKGRFVVLPPGTAAVVPAAQPPPPPPPPPPPEPTVATPPVTPGGNQQAQPEVARRGSSLTKPPASFDAKGVASNDGLGKVYYFLNQMKLEVTDADKNMKSLQNELKAFKEKNKELEARAREMERRWSDEKLLREASDIKVRTLRKKLRELKESAAVPFEGTISAPHSRGSSLDSMDDLVGTKVVTPADVSPRKSHSVAGTPQTGAAKLSTISSNDTSSLAEKQEMMDLQLDHGTAKVVTDTKVAEKEEAVDVAPKKMAAPVKQAEPRTHRKAASLGAEDIDFVSPTRRRSGSETGVEVFMGLHQSAPVSPNAPLVVPQTGSNSPTPHAHELPVQEVGMNGSLSVGSSVTDQDFRAAMSQAKSTPNLSRSVQQGLGFNIMNASATDENTLQHTVSTPNMMLGDSGMMLGQMNGSANSLNHMGQPGMMQQQAQMMNMAQQQQQQQAQQLSMNHMSQQTNGTSRHSHSASWGQNPLNAQHPMVRQHSTGHVNHFHQPGAQQQLAPLMNGSNQMMNAQQPQQQQMASNPHAQQQQHVQQPMMNGTQSQPQQMLNDALAQQAQQQQMNPMMNGQLAHQQQMQQAQQLNQMMAAQHQQQPTAQMSPMMNGQQTTQQQQPQMNNPMMNGQVAPQQQQQPQQFVPDQLQQPVLGGQPTQAVFPQHQQQQQQHLPMNMNGSSNAEADEFTQFVSERR